MNSIINMGDIVDQLLQVKASITELQEKEKMIKDCLVNTGEKSIEGMLARVSISYCDGRAKVDWESIAHKMGTPSRQLITAHTTYGQPFHVVRVSARKGSK